jgi:uncharacterized protein YcaQ
LTLKINNRGARRLWLSSHGIATAPTGQLDVMQIVRKLGFVQLDTIRVISRAHHHIIWSRNQNYREPMLNRLMADKRAVFEHYTHDASILPMEYYPMWQRQFQRHKNRIDRSKYYTSMTDQAGRELIKQRIANEGPLSTHSFDTKRSAPKEMWSRPPHKLALDYMWYIGELSTSHRKNFTKFYDLSTRVIPNDLRTQNHADKDQINWLCQSALDRLGIATLGEIQRFWGAVDAREVKAWATSAQLTPVSVQGADGSWIDAYGAHDIEHRLENIENPTSRLRILNPFDPVVRDRTRLERLFGFDYRIEIFVPAEKRKWGYYVFPLLEADKFIGRIEAKADRQNSVINVLNVWIEPNVKWTRARAVKLDAELNRIARFVSINDVKWHCTHPSASL